MAVKELVRRIELNGDAREDVALHALRIRCNDGKTKTYSPVVATLARGRFDFVAEGKTRSIETLRIQKIRTGRDVEQLSASERFKTIRIETSDGTSYTLVLQKRHDPSHMLSVIGQYCML